jgi:hypothetical protein
MSTQIISNQANSIQIDSKDMMDLTQLGYGTRGWDTLEKKEFKLWKEKVWLKVFLNVV